MSAQSEVFSSHDGSWVSSIGDRNEFGHKEKIDKIKSGNFNRLILYGQHGPYTEGGMCYPWDVCIDFNKINDREWKEGLCVREGNFIALLGMRDVQFGSTNLPNFGVFGPLLQKLEKLDTLDIRRCQIGTDGLELIAETFHSFGGNNLKALCLQGCNIDDFRTLVRYPLQNLSCLELSQNSLESEENCCAVGSMLELHGKKLKTLYLEECSIDDKGAEILSNALEKNESLTSIALRGNSFGSQGRAAFRRLLSRNPSLMILGTYESRSVLHESSKKSVGEGTEKYRVKEASDKHRNYIANLKKEIASRDNEIASRDNEIALLKSELEHSKIKKTIDLTTDDNHNGETDSKPPPSKRLRSSGTKPSGLACLHEQSQAVAKIKVEATERAAEAERKAEAAIQEKELAELKLECPTCFEVDKDSSALVPCGHTFCSDCCNSKEWTNCPACRKEVVSCLRLFR